MPNWVLNKVAVNGDDKRVSAFLAAVLDDAGNFDFNKIIPMPESLEIVSGSFTQEAILAYGAVNNEDMSLVVLSMLKNLFYDKACLKRDLEHVDRLVSEWKKEHECSDISSIDLSADGSDFRKGPEETLESYARYGKVYFDNLQKYGATDWYVWRCDSWGTKWNASDTRKEVVENGVILTFDTAWSMPQPIFERLAAMFPDLDLSGCWADEDLGSNCGLWNAKDGVVAFVNERSLPDPLKHAFDVWGYDYDDVAGEINGDTEEPSYGEEDDRSGDEPEIDFLSAIHIGNEGLRSCRYDNHGHKCVLCGGKLGTTYLEKRLYAVRCPHCNTVTLVEAGSPGEAEGKIGAKAD